MGSTILIWWGVVGILFCAAGFALMMAGSWTQDKIRIFWKKEIKPAKPAEEHKNPESVEPLQHKEDK
ncbi:MAG: hypothetical protein V1661_00845 [bacterium]